MSAFVIRANAGQFQPPPLNGTPVTVVNTAKSPVPVCNTCDRAVRAFSSIIRDETPCTLGGTLAEVPPGFRLVVEYVSARSRNPLIPIEGMVLSDSGGTAFAAIGGGVAEFGAGRTRRDIWTASEQVTLYVNGGETLTASFPHPEPFVCGPGHARGERPTSETVIGISGYLVPVP